MERWHPFKLMRCIHQPKKNHFLVIHKELKITSLNLTLGPDCGASLIGVNGKCMKKHTNIQHINTGWPLRKKTPPRKWKEKRSCRTCFMGTPLTWDFISYYFASYWKVSLQTSTTGRGRSDTGEAGSLGSTFSIFWRHFVTRSHTTCEVFVCFSMHPPQISIQPAQQCGP